MTTAVSTIAPRRGMRGRWGEPGHGRAALLFLAPAMLGFLIFYLRPAVLGFWNSFTDKELLRPKSEFIGLENYRDIIDDDVFRNALWVTLKYVAYNIGIQTVCAIAIAWMLDKLSGSRLLRTVVLSPWLMSNVVVGLLFLWILDFRLGVANAFLEWLGIGAKPFFTSDTWAIPTIAGINVWRHMGYTALLLFAGLQTIPKSVKEAAFVDGCGEAKRFFHVILPLMRPVLAVVIVITVIGSFQIFDTVDVTTGGGPVNATRVIYVYIFDQAFGRRNFGYASAMAVILFLILALVTFVQMRVLRANESDLA
jgi:multiple sugar transport system permease protein